MDSLEINLLSAHSVNHNDIHQCRNSANGGNNVVGYRNSGCLRIQRSEGRRKTERRTGGRRRKVVFGMQRRERRKKARERAGGMYEEALRRREVRMEDAGKVLER